MTSDTISQTVLFPELLDKLLVVAFDRPRASSDRVMILSEVREAPGLFERAFFEEGRAGRQRNITADERLQGCSTVRRHSSVLCVSRSAVQINRAPSRHRIAS